MKCGEFAEIVHDLARARQLGEVEAAIGRAHAESCPACGCLLAEAQRLAGVLREASVESRGLEAPEGVESGLMAAFRAANSAPRQSRPRPKPKWLLGLGLAGAGVLASLLVFVWLARSPGRRPSSAAASAATGSATEAIAEQKAPAGQTAAMPANLPAQPNTSLVSGFVPVPFAGGIARGDTGVIVRVQVPRSALAELGYPIDETGGEGMVQADLLVGEDGWPHAVRIVR
ncbi:MAG TPA: hypothetical protein VNJ12_08670 [Candidatus Dormibacteraeota bacterium]|nr:hypothetical protein [Candidatus Dormibacteraeota bacterium]